MRTEILLDIQEHVLDVQDRIWFPLDPFVQFPKVVDEPYGTIFLGNDERRSRPLGTVHLLEHSYFH